MIQVMLKGDAKEFEAGVTAAEVAKSIGAGLYKAACACKIDGEAADLRTPLTKDCSLEILTFDSAEGKHAYWHTTAHIMAQAIGRLYPGAKFAIGPAIENGFYYDVDLPQTLTPDDLTKIEAEMKKIIKEDLPLERFELSPADAEKLMADKQQDYKLELIAEHSGKGEPISFYQQGEYVDLCAGPHLMSTGHVKAVKLTNCTGAYWRADANNKMLQRVYGISFPKAADLEAYITMLEEAKKRDHRKLGRDLELFTIMDEGPGFPFFLPKGMVLKNLLIDYWRELHRKAGYLEISTPMILNRSLWERSGHWDHYKQNMYTTVIDEQDFAIKPMNCPGGMLVYKTKLHSYRDLPLRMGELGLVHRHELSGALHGLMRVRCFTQDDAHIFMTPDQIKNEIKGVVNLIDSVYKTFGFQYHIELSTMPEDHMGAQEDWDNATDALRAAISELGYDYEVNEGDGAFYGPKLDFHLTDCLGRTWQCGTIQLDFQLPERFELEYTGEDGAKHRPIMIHRVVFGSIERFIGILTEHFAGAFPLWLSPVQVKVLPISERHHEYAEKVAAQLQEAGLRVEADLRNEKIGYKIREAQLQKTPYMLVVGDKEAETGTVSVRGRKDGDLGSMALADFSAKACEESKNRVMD
ncbi:threonine--tRNA ligase [Anaeromassilibacillus sp. An200]|uniref:Threonine--tRNA ligase n=1 Tax=Candidatus Caccousia stercoris TaxID=2840723 RepID=A0A9D1FRK2_9FIRM|nr:threonine--tRNA ligase [Anaeromassilibacillus sp. An200]OUP09585.1 threonine--tRNA ligase [Anaeromassilibacillus sp. An200]HIS78688.1 threonine--tRNA ligase [Candidatus Caccousia stercoris]